MEFEHDMDRGTIEQQMLGNAERQTKALESISWALLCLLVTVLGGLVILGVYGFVVRF